MGGRWKSYATGPMKRSATLVRKARGRTYTKNLDNAEASRMRGNNNDATGYSYVTLNSGQNIRNIKTGIRNSSGISLR